jgi:hypothetical protein
MELISALADDPVVLIVIYGLYYLIVGLTKIAALRAAIKGVPPEQRAEVIIALSTMFPKHDVRGMINGSGRKKPLDKDPTDDDGD